MIQGSGRCQYHPERVGVGICVECRKVICVECTTQFEGINRCARCLSLKLQKAARFAGRKEWTFGNVVLALLSLGVLFGGIYLTASLVASGS
jgi:hypothetical protein